MKAAHVRECIASSSQQDPFHLNRSQNSVLPSQVVGAFCPAQYSGCNTETEPGLEHLGRVSLNQCHSWPASTGSNEWQESSAQPGEEVMYPQGDENLSLWSVYCPAWAGSHPLPTVTSHPFFSVQSATGGQQRPAVEPAVGVCSEGTQNIPRGSQKTSLVAES